MNGTRNRSAMVAAFILTPILMLAGPTPTSAGKKDDPGQGPLLQLYLEGSTYNAETETWELAPTGSSDGEAFNLWTIARTTRGNGKHDQPIYDTRLAVSYDKAFGEDIQINLAVSTVSVLKGGFIHVSEVVRDPIQIGTNVGGRPVLSDGKELAWHGVYGDETIWQEFYLGHAGAVEETDSDGNMVLTDGEYSKESGVDEEFNDFDHVAVSDGIYGPLSPIADFIGSFPELDADANLLGQINVYNVTVTNPTGGATPDFVHFDLYNHVESKNNARALFAPFSHSAAIIPTPSAALAGLAMLGMLGMSRRRLQRQAC